MPVHTLDVLIMKEGEWWVAQCLQADLATQAKSLDELHDEMARLIVGHLMFHARENLDPFANVPAAPRRFWNLYERAAGRYEPRRTASPRFEGMPMMPSPPATEYRISA